MAESCMEKTLPRHITWGATKPLVVPAAARGKSCHRMRGDTQMRPRLQTQMRPRLQTHKITISNESTSTGWQVRARTSYPSWHKALMLPGPSSPAGPPVATQDTLQACSVLPSYSPCSHRPLCEMASLSLRRQSRYLGIKSVFSAS